MNNITSTRLGQVSYSHYFLKYCIAFGFVFMVGVMTANVEAQMRLPWGSDKTTIAKPLDFTAIVEQSKPAVVKVIGIRKVKERQQQYPPGFENMPEMFRRHFFGAPQPQPRNREKQALGSGFIITNDGYIVTNEHVIARADEIIVRLGDRREFNATLVGVDKRSDIALLKIELKNLPIIKFGDSDDVQEGQWVIAIGSPFGLDFSVSAGIVSAKGRSLPNDKNENYVPFIQSDVAINPGNSGGPLLNLEGEAIGVNSQIYTRDGGSLGISFTIPSSVVVNVVEQIRDKGFVSRGWLGIAFQEITSDLADSFDMGKPEGALVVRVIEDSPAEKAGLEAGDIIVAFNDVPIVLSGDLPHLIGNQTSGSKIKLDFLRDGKRSVAYPVLTSLDSDEEGSDKSGQITGSASRLGFRVEELTPQQRERYQINSGVIVSEISSGSLVDRAGISRGDVVLRVNGKQINSMRDFESLIKVEAGTALRLYILTRNGSYRYVGLRMPKSDAK